MTLFTTDYLEYYLTLVSWIVNNGIWAALVSSGVFALPFVAIVVQEWLKARAEGADEGNKGVLSAARIENRVFVAIVVVMFAGIPFIDVDLNTIQYDSSRSAQCQVSVAQPADTGWSQSFSTINNQSAKVPVWWAFMHALSRAVTGASVAAIPCGTDLRQMRMEIDATRIDDPVLAQEVADFSRDCYGPARAKLFMQRPQLDEQQMHDVTWIGSRFFTDTNGYYDTYRSSTPRDDWPYDSNRDAGLAQVSSGGGYPTCRQWWADGSNGLRARLLGQVDPSLLNRLAGWAGFLSRAEVDNSVIRAIASPRQQKLNQGSVYTDYGGQIDKTLPNIVTRATGDVGMAVGAIASFPAMDVVRQALPMVLALLKMALVICIPLVLVVGTYDLKTVVTVSVVQFALFFTDFWFQLARWIDSTILDALYGWGFGWNRPHTNFDPLVGLNNAFGDMLLMFVTGTMFLVLPTFWVAALGGSELRLGDCSEPCCRLQGNA
ncbi:conjugal transfer protein TraG [Pseudomonas aeruginosa]|nr:conjugal transfer protein TraG [Pseudomonas aeruginosa]